MHVFLVMIRMLSTIACSVSVFQLHKQSNKLVVPDAGLETCLNAATVPVAVARHLSRPRCQRCKHSGESLTPSTCHWLKRGLCCLAARLQHWELHGLHKVLCKDRLISPETCNSTAEKLTAEYARAYLLSSVGRYWADGRTSVL